MVVIEHSVERSIEHSVGHSIEQFREHSVQHFREYFVEHSIAIAVDGALGLPESCVGHKVNMRRHMKRDASGMRCDAQNCIGHD